MKIESKWKRAAVAHHLSDYTGDGAELFDELMAEPDENKLREVFDAKEAVTWRVYEYDDLVDVVDRIKDMAETLQLAASGDFFGED